MFQDISSRAFNQSTFLAKQRKAIYSRVFFQYRSHHLSISVSFRVARDVMLAPDAYSPAVDTHQAPVGFGKQGAAYAKFRPDYPEDLYKVVLAPLKPDGRVLAVDVATGSGQAAKGLSTYFEKVVALDRDAEQLKHAVHIQNVTHQQGEAEQFGLEDNSADLVAVAQGLHWYRHHLHVCCSSVPQFATVMILQL